MILPEYPEKGKPVTAEWGKRVIDCLRALRVTACAPLTASTGPGGTTMAIRPMREGGAAGGFGGVAYSPSGVKTDGLNTYSDRAWVRYSATDDEFTEQIGPPPAPWGADEVWFEKSHTYGDIVVTRF